MDVIIDRGVLDCCEHWFCFACIDNWATITNLCPLCQNEFQLITCVPVYDTIGSGNVEDDSLSRDDDWCIQGTNNTLSFPSYYIDENAVICLDGNGCKIRNGVATSGDDAVLDTSIACDSCDLWYHAFCVDFDPESTSESSWLCPRCIDEVPQKSDGISKQVRNIQNGPESGSREHSVEASHSKNVSVSVADAGETAVVVSMIEGDHWINRPSENSLSAQDINKNNQTLNTQPYVDAEEKSLALSLSQDTHFAAPCDSLLVSVSETKFIDQAVSEPNVSDRCKLFTGLLSDQLNIESEPSEIESNVDLHLGLSLGSSLPVDKTNLDANEDAVGSSCVKRKSMSSRDDVLVTGHSKEDNICTTDEMVADPPAKKAKGVGESQQTRLTDEGRKPLSGSIQECSHLLANSKDEVDNINTRDELVAEVPAKKNKVDGKSRQKHSKPEVKKSISGRTQDSGHPSAGSKDDKVRDVPEQEGSTPGHPSAGSKDDKLRDVPEQEGSTPDIMRIVRRTNWRRSGGVTHSNPADKSSIERENGAGLRVKKIMRRAAEDESSKLVENLRKEIREAVRSKATKDFSKSNLFDPKLLIAFRNAIAGTRPEREPVKKLNLSDIRAKQLMLQKGKTRENLTKKIYGNSNGRRKRAWDRDWEVEFWKHRCRRVSKPEKVETLKSVLDLLSRNSESSEMENEPGEEAANPILSRLYLADASVFPRKDDIKPLSDLMGTGNNEANKEQSVKEKFAKPVNDSHIFRSRLQISKSSSQYSKDEAACNKSHPNGPIKKQSSTSMASDSKVNDQSTKENPGKFDVKSDKRKWALEFLARKTSTVQKNPTQGKEEDSNIVKRKFPLLAQLPPDMRPVLAPSIHNKIPTSVRQAQLYRLTEHLLRKADLPVIRRTADTELAVADAVNIEKEAVNRSNSKLVYVNLCSQMLSQQMSYNKPDSPGESELSQSVVHTESIDPGESEPSQSVVHSESIDPASMESSNLSAEAALRLAGLLSDSPPNSPCRPDIEDNNLSIDGNKGPDNVFDIDVHAELDIYGDFEYDLENEDYIGGLVPKVSNLQTGEGDSKLKVVFSTLITQRTDDVMNPQDNKRHGINKGPKDSPFHELHKDEELLGLVLRTESSCPPPEPLQEEIGGDPFSAECELEELYGPDKEPLVDRFPDYASREGYVSVGKEVLTENEGPRENVDSIPNKADFDSEICPENISVRNGLPIDSCSSGGENSANRSLVNENLPREEKKTNKSKKADIIRSISKKVEIYIKEHIRPLCKSGVITVEQYRWAVERTTAKIMKYHSRDTDAKFLIKEGEKVKKLAEQYVEASQMKDSS